MTLTTDEIIRELRLTAELRAEQERYLYEDAAERPDPEDHIEWKGADELEQMLLRVDELSQQSILWRVGMGSWVQEAREEYEARLSDPATDKGMLRWYRDALGAVVALQDAIPSLAPKEPKP